MGWAETLLQVFKNWQVSLLTGVPDSAIGRIMALAEQDPFFRTVWATREEEAVGIAVGYYAVGHRSAVLMQSSGLGNSVNALASLCIPARAPIPLVINLRGGLREFNIAQVPMGQAVGRILDALSIPHYTLEEERRLAEVVDGALRLCYASRQPVALCLTSLLHGGKLV